MRTGPICNVPLRVLLTKLVNKQVYMTSHSPGLFIYYMLRSHKLSISFISVMSFVLTYLSTNILNVTSEWVMGVSIREDFQMEF